MAAAAEALARQPRYALGYGIMAKRKSRAHRKPKPNTRTARRRPASSAELGPLDAEVDAVNQAARVAQLLPK